MTALCSGTIAVLAVAYMGLIAVVMSYATLTVEFSQSVRNDEAEVAGLEETYLTIIEDITNTDYVTAGYVKPNIKLFVPSAGMTAMR